MLHIAGNPPVLWNRCGSALLDLEVTLRIVCLPSPFPKPSWRHLPLFWMNISFSFMFVFSHTPSLPSIVIKEISSSKLIGVFKWSFPSSCSRVHVKFNFTYIFHVTAEKPFKTSLALWQLLFVLNKNDSVLKCILLLLPESRLKDCFCSKMAVKIC